MNKARALLKRGLPTPVAAWKGLRFLFGRRASKLYLYALFSGRFI